MTHVFKGHVPSLDGLRALAVMGVMAVHSGVPGFESGWLGVDLFFALSGYLITTLLLKEFDKRGDVSLGNFWARRFLRLMPAYMFYITGITIAMWYWSGSVLSTHGGWSPELYTFSLWAYFVNFAPKGGIWNGQNITVHLWSLAVEEQYYLLWPLVLAFLMRTRYLLPVAWGAALITLVFYVGWASEFSQTYMLYARGMSLFFASALAVTLWASPIGSRYITNVASSNALFIVVTVITVIVFTIGATKGLSDAQTRYYFLPWLSFGFALLVIRCAVTEGRIPGWLAHPWLVQIGKISYGIYLYHELVRVGVWYVTSELFSGFSKYFAYGLRLALYFIGTIFVAWLSYRFIEQPFLQLKNRFRS